MREVDEKHIGRRVLLRGASLARPAATSLAHSVIGEPAHRTRPVANDGDAA
jgi:hypothetical protein